MCLVKFLGTLIHCRNSYVNSLHTALLRLFKTSCLKVFQRILQRLHGGRSLSVCRW